MDRAAYRHDLRRAYAPLGYERYGAQGGGVGAFVFPDLGRLDPEHVVGWIMSS